MHQGGEAERYIQKLIEDDEPLHRNCPPQLSLIIRRISSTVIILLFWLLLLLILTL